MKAKLCTMSLLLGLAGCASSPSPSLDSSPDFVHFVQGGHVAIESCLWKNAEDSEVPSDSVNGHITLSAQKELPASYTVKGVLLYQQGHPIRLQEQQLDIDVSNQHHWEILFHTSLLKTNRKPVDVLLLLGNQKTQGWLSNKQVIIDKVKNKSL